MPQRAKKVETAADIPVVSDALKNKLRCWLALARDGCMVEARLSELLRPLDLSVAQHEVLAKLLSRDGITQQELAGRLLVTKGNVTGLLKRLEERGLVERRSDPDDARKNLVYLTRRGRALEVKALAVQHELIDEVFDVLEPDEVASLLDMMERMGDRLRAFRR